MILECLDVAGVDDHSPLIAALNKDKEQESKLKEVVIADEELAQQEF